MQDKLYSFVMRGELAKVALNKSEIVSKHAASEILSEEYIQRLAIDMLDDELVNGAKLMATVYTAIAAFENGVRQFVVKILIEKYGEDWWQKSVSEKIRKKAETRKEEELKIKWHTQRGDSNINYVDFGELGSIMTNNLELFQDHIVSIEWAKAIFSTLERSRNVIMHSGELGKRDIERVGTNIRDWVSQVGQ